MKRYVSIDGGTTNTRLSLVEDGKIVDTVKFPIGARAGINDKTVLKNAVKQGISNLLAKNSLKECDIAKIIASGMITSDTGLVSLPHLTLPVGIEELKKGSYEAALPEISNIPFVFIRGVKTAVESLDGADMMRGEETEIMGFELDGDAAYMLMGSHTKIIKLDKNGKIADFTTTLTGELIAALATGTILKDSFSLEFDDFDKASLLKGFEYSKTYGINEALFKTRIMKNLFSATELEAYSFFLGVCLSAELEALTKMNAEKVFIGGKRQLKRAIHALLKASGFSAEMLSDEAVDASVVKGQIKIYEYEV